MWGQGYPSRRVEPGDNTDLRELGERAGCRKPRKADIYGVFWNARLELFGGFQCVGGGGSVHYSQETGFTLMREVMQELGFQDRFVRRLDFNESGQILVSLLDRDEQVTVLLTPVD